MLERATATACRIEKGAFTCIMQLSLSCLPKIKAYGWYSFSRMKFLVDATPANPWKSSLKLRSEGSKEGSLDLSCTMCSCSPLCHLSKRTYQALRSMTVKSVNALSQVERRAMNRLGWSFSWVQAMQPICFLQFSMILVFEQSSPASQKRNSLPMKSESNLARKLMCSQEKWTWLLEKRYPPRVLFWTASANWPFSEKKHLQVVESRPLSVFWRSSDT